MKRLLLIIIVLFVGISSINLAWGDEEVSLFEQPAEVKKAEDVTVVTGQNQASEEAPTENADEAQPFMQTLPDGSTVLTVTAVGDITIGGDVRNRNKSIFDRELAKQGNDLNFVMRNVRDLLSQDDLTIANLETTFTTAPVHKKSNQFVFSAPTNYVDVLKDGSIEAVTIENNHIMDHGQAGLDETIQTVENAGITWGNTAHPAVFQKAGIKVTILAYQTFDGRYPALFEQIPKDIAAAKTDSHVVITAFHWGAELDYAPNANQIKMGRLCIDSGADLVIGHHSHRINPIEEYQGKYIVYSLANFSFAGNSKPKDMSTFIFQCRFAVKEGDTRVLGFRIIPARISSKTDYNDFAPTPFTDQRLIDNVINVLKANSKSLEHAVTHYPVDWE